MTLVQPASPAVTPGTLPEAPARPRQFLCPACRRAALVLVMGAPEVARCSGCSWSTDSLLRLVPTRPATLSELLLGGGVAGLLRALLLLLVVGALGVAVLLHP